MYGYEQFSSLCGLGLPQVSELATLVVMTIGPQFSSKAGVRECAYARVCACVTYVRVCACRCVSVFLHRQLFIVSSRTCLPVLLAVMYVWKSAAVHCPTAKGATISTICPGNIVQAQYSSSIHTVAVLFAAFAIPLKCNAGIGCPWRLGHQIRL